MSYGNMAPYLRDRMSRHATGSLVFDAERAARLSGGETDRKKNAAKPLGPGKRGAR